MAEVALLPAAEEDYRQALACYQGRSAQAAAGFEAAVEIAPRAIGESPERWTKCDATHRFYALRRYPYSIYYRVEVRGVVVVYVPLLAFATS